MGDTVVRAEITGPGYTEDPYNTPGEKVEGFFVGKLVGSTLGWIGRHVGIPTLDDPSGFLSTYREWHISMAGVWAGLRAGTFADIPECPPLWQDELQYYRGFAAFANVVKCQWPTFIGGITIITGAIASGLIKVG